MQQRASLLPGLRKHTVYHDALSEQQPTNSSCGKFPDLERRLLLGVPTRADHFPSHQHTSEQRSMSNFSSLFSFLSILTVEQDALRTEHKPLCFQLWQFTAGTDTSSGLPGRSLNYICEPSAGHEAGGNALKYIPHYCLPDLQSRQ